METYLHEKLQTILRVQQLPERLVRLGERYEKLCRAGNRGPDADPQLLALLVILAEIEPAGGPVDARSSPTTLPAGRRTSERKSRSISVRISPTELTTLRAKAHASGLRLTDFIVGRCLESTLGQQFDCRT
jgi:hypothetical protein